MRALRCSTLVLSLGLIVAVAGTVAGSGAQASEAERVTRAEAAFAGWLDRVDAAGRLALYRQGRAVAVLDAGRDPQAPAEMASVGKAITGICAAALVARGDLEWSDTVRARLGRGPDITLGALLTHSSGLITDSTQALMVENYGRTGPHLSARVLEQIEARGGPQGASGRYHYNNENYALAGLMIEAASQDPYADICTELALDPVGVRAVRSEAAAISLPWGGWTMRVADFARWHATWFGPDRPPGADPEALPAAEIEGGLHYGLGTFFRVLERGPAFWHFGALCFPGRLEMGSYAATWFGDWTVVASYDVCVSFEEMWALDQALVTALLAPL